MENMIKEVLAEFGIEKEFSSETTLTELEISSILILEIIVAFEEKYGFSFDDEDLTQENFETIGSLSNLIGKYVEQRA